MPKAVTTETIMDEHLGTKERRGFMEMWILEALIDLEGMGSVVDITRQVWSNHASEIDGEFFFTWQYDLRWASQALVHRGYVSKTGRAWRLNLT